MAAKRRADQLLVEQGLAESRAKAQALILAGLVSTAGRRIDQPGTLLPAPLALTADRAALVALIKPQFEAGPSDVGKGGVVRDPAIRRAVCERIAGWVGAQPGWHVIDITESPITGPAGNHEFLLY